MQKALVHRVHGVSSVIEEKWRDAPAFTNLMGCDGCSGSIEQDANKFDVRRLYDFVGRMSHATGCGSRPVYN